MSFHQAVERASFSADGMQADAGAGGASVRDVDDSICAVIPAMATSVEKIKTRFQCPSHHAMGVCGGHAYLTGLCRESGTREESA